MAIFGPFNEISSLQVQSICEHLEIPHIKAQLDYNFEHRTDLSINMFPHLSIMSKVYIDLLDTWEWKTFAIIYEESENIIHFNDFFVRAQEKNYDLKLFQLQPDRPYRDILWQLKEIQITNVLLHVRTGHIVEVLRQVSFIIFKMHFFLYFCFC